MKDFIKIRSVIGPRFAQDMLFKSMIVASFAAFFILIFGAFTPISYLSSYGSIGFITCVFLIAYALKPYKHLNMHQLKGSELIFCASDLKYSVSGEAIFSIPLSLIKKIEYFQDGQKYGLCLFLEKAGSEKMQLHKAEYFIEADKTLIKLPYFPKNKVDEIIQLLKELKMGV